MCVGACVCGLLLSAITSTTVNPTTTTCEVTCCVSAVELFCVPPTRIHFDHFSDEKLQIKLLCELIP